MNAWFQRILLVAAGFALGIFLHHPQNEHRFIWDTNGNVLDSKTGQACVPVPVKENGTNLPICLDIYKHY